MTYNSSQNNDVVKTALGGARKRRKKKKAFRVKMSNKIKALGVTDFKKRTVTINRKWNKPGDNHRRTKNPKIPEVLRTRLHERRHVQKPRATEKQAEKFALKQSKKMSRKQKKKEYSRVLIYKH